MIGDFSLLYLAFSKGMSDIPVDMDLPFKNALCNVIHEFPPAAFPKCLLRSLEFLFTVLLFSNICREMYELSALSVFMIFVTAKLETLTKLTLLKLQSFINLTNENKTTTQMVKASYIISLTKSEVLKNKEFLCIVITLNPTWCVIPAALFSQPCKSAMRLTFIL